MEVRLYTPRSRAKWFTGEEVGGPGGGFKGHRQRGSRPRVTSTTAPRLKDRVSISRTSDFL